MTDMQVRYEKLLADAAECALLRDLETDSEKRELFARLSEHLGVLASLMERAVGLQKGRGIHPSAAGLTTETPARHGLEARRL
jgi:hypothetical protein